MDNKKDLSNEFEFMLHCLRHDTTEEEIIRFKELDWSAFVELTKHHRVYPQVYLKLNPLAFITKIIPGEIMKQLQQLYTENTFKMLQLTREMGIVCGMFSQHQVPLIVLKGPVLGAKLYGDISKRTSKDLDLLVSPESIHTSINLLIELGYQMKDERLLDNWMYKNHHLTFDHPVKRVQVELHWRLNPNLGGTPSFNYFWSRKSEVMISNQTYHCLADEDLMLYLSEHGSRHGWSRLRWLVDIDRMLKGETLEFEGLLFSLKQYKVKHYLTQAVLLSQHLLSSTIPVGFSSIISEHTSNKKFEKVSETIKQTLFYERHRTNIRYDWNFFLLMSGSQKLHYIRMLFTPSSKDATMLPLAKRLHFVYFFLRPLFVVLRFMRRRRSRYRAVEE